MKPVAVHHVSAIDELRAEGVDVSDAVPVASRQAFLIDPAGNGVELHEVAPAGCRA